MSRILRFAINKSYTICNALRGMKLKSGSLVHYRSEIRCRHKVMLGERSILYKKQSIYIGRNGRLNIGMDSHIAPYGYLLIEDRSISIGDDVAIGPFCSFFCSSNSYSAEKPLFRDNYDKGDISIGNNVFIGAQSVILPGTIIGNNIIVAANSVVKGKLEDGWLYAGSPCKPIKKLEVDD
ncbi:MAG: acyltransferase [Bacteroidales bacterium]|jgi:acetyltransferase-like isoleucine patch superfamily enzyme|nr:acyltransferase [Bacteroidales bacterium]